MRAPLKERVLDVVAPTLLVAVFIALLVCAVLFALAIGGEPVPCRLAAEGDAACAPEAPR